MIDLTSIKSRLLGIGYDSALFSEGVCGLGREEDSAEPLFVAHSRLPRDIRTSAVAVVMGGRTPERLASARQTGAPVVLGFDDRGWTCGSFREAGIDIVGEGALDSFDAYLERHREALRPDAVYRAKTWGRIDPEARQTDFVDFGWLPLVEGEYGRRVTKLLEESVADLAAELDWKELDEGLESQGKAEWLIKAPFWLLAAKTLRDKGVAQFRKFDLGDFETVFSRLASHYKSDPTDSVKVAENRIKALSGVAKRIGDFASLELMSTETLGYVYESALINQATRKRLGTHCTPVWLVDYILGLLRPWIAEMPPEKRFVFEPACGHGGFLVGALRLLDELRPADFPENRERYLRRRLAGFDIDLFSLEIARLALTLADVPNPNGWSVKHGHLFESDLVETMSASADVVIANPPFENFPKGRASGLLSNKAAETLSRVVRRLPVGGAFAFVLPQNVLKSGSAKDLRTGLLEAFEIREITLFADKVFRYGMPESAVVVARRVAADARPLQIGFRRVREKEVKQFSEAFEGFPILKTSNRELLEEEEGRLFIPELREVWRELGKRGLALKDVSLVGKGFDFVSSDSIPRGASRFDETEFPDAVPGFATWRRGTMTHELPNEVWMNLAIEAIATKRVGTASGQAQVVFNYAPVSRGPWRMSALIDEAGHPVTSRFGVARPASKQASLASLWALLNSPVANAFAFSHLTKRDNLVGVIERLPVPDLIRSDLRPLEEAVRTYLEAARRWSLARAQSDTPALGELFEPADAPRQTKPIPSENDLRILHWRIDAEVMKLYALPPKMEREVLLMFSGERRRGVPFVQTEYFPPRINGLRTVEDLLAISADWERLAGRKSDLIRRKVEKSASGADLEELADLKRLSGSRVDLLHPLPIDQLEAARDELKRILAIEPA